MSGHYELYSGCRINTNALEIGKRRWFFGMRVDAGIKHNPTIVAQMYYDRFAKSGAEDRNLKFFGGWSTHYAIC
jgi:hypothetical protein